MKKQLVVLVALVTLASAKVMPCAGSKGPLPKLVTDDDCDLDSDERCGFIRGKSFKADITFTALTEIKSMIPQVNVTVGGVKGETQLPSDRYEACDWLLDGAQMCPIPKGKDTTWRLNIPVSLTDPLVPLTLEVSLFGSDGVPQICFVILGKIVPF